MRINLPYIRRDCDRHGNLRIYVRVPGKKQVRIHAQPGTPEFLDAYRAALEGARPQSKATRGTFAWLVEAYYQSAECGELDPRTQHTRRLILAKLVDAHGGKPVALLEPRHVRQWRDAKAATPDAANNMLKALRRLFAWAVEHECAERNPVREVAYLRSKNPAGFHTWSPEEVAQYRARHPIGTTARLALELLLCTGVRRSDAVRIGRQMVCDGRIRFTETKGAKRKPKGRVLPILPQLQAVIDATPVTGVQTYLVTQYGKPFTVAGFGNKFREWCNEAGLPHCSAHGLRKAGATIAAENGATPYELMAIFGWTTLKQAELYTREADRERLAEGAMKLLAKE